MRHEPIGKKLFIQNRKAFRARLEARALAVFHANDIMPTSADGTMPFVQDSDIFYLTGVNQEDTILLIAPDAPEERFREVLFVKRTNEHIKVWEGEKLTKERAAEVSGIETVLWFDEFMGIFPRLVFQAKYLYLNTNEHTRATAAVQTRNDRFIEECKQRFPLHRYERIAPIMHEIRAIKSDREVELMQKACDITEKGFRRLLSFIKPGVKEYEIEAELMHEFLRNGSRGFSYEPILASGADSCVLHYNKNDKACQDGDLILMDFGAEYAHYHSDLSRTVPVNGRFTKRQREVYDVVLKIQRAAMKLLNSSHTLDSYHKAVGELATEECLKLGILTQEEVKNQSASRPAYKKYFMHGTSHYIGLNTHDFGRFDRPIQKGMAFTVEPGIYLPEEGFGIRLENDIIVTENGYLDLMRNIPIEAEEIEDLMNA
ncbi:MAG: aminopeptidase P N-terminal domain-containing protein [Bacteroidota bacterium]